MVAAHDCRKREGCCRKRCRFVVENEAAVFANARLRNEFIAHPFGALFAFFLAFQGNPAMSSIKTLLLKSFHGREKKGRALNMRVESFGLNLLDLIGVVHRKAHILLSAQRKRRERIRQIFERYDKFNLLNKFS